jgi:hypothetical protein
MLANGGSVHSGDQNPVAALQQQVLSLQTKLASIYGDLQHAQIMRGYAERSLALSESLREQAEERGRKQERERIAKQQRAAAEAESLRQMAEEEREDAEQAAEHEKERDGVIARYGSAAAVLVPCEREKLLKASVRQWSKFYTTGAPEWTTSICRCVDLATILGRKKLTHIVDAISQAYPLPETVEEATSELAYWKRRVRETALARLGLDQGYGWMYFHGGDLTIRIRQHVLRGLIDTMPARTVQDVLARMQGREDMTPDLQKTVIADLKALSAATETVVSHEEFRAARQKGEAPVSKAKPQKQANVAQSDFGF